MEIFSIASGSSGNCTYIRTEHADLLVDTGISAKRIINSLESLDSSIENVDGILITHEHIDHIRSIGTISRKYGIPIYATEGTIDGITDTSRIGKIDEGLFNRVRARESISIKDVDIDIIRTCHDANDPVAYRFESGGKAAAIVTDLGCFDDEIIAKLENLDGMILESNHDVRMLETGTYPFKIKQRILGNNGHLSNVSAGELLSILLHRNLKNVLLGHLSRENNMPFIAEKCVENIVNSASRPYAERPGITVASPDVITALNLV